MAAHEIAAGAGMVYLTGVARHEHRENLLRDNIANRVGLAREPASAKPARKSAVWWGGSAMPRRR